MAQSSPWVLLSSATREIRLLDLAPRSGEPDKLSCNLRNVSLDDEPAYEALSYVWGKKAVPPHILCVGGQDLHITSNLFDALHSLRWDNKVRTLWVDAVCIRQTDDEERSWQVSMMGDIYRSSRMVLVWLGLNDVDLIRDILFHVSDMDAHFAESPAPILNLLLTNPWWRRAWTLQEAVLAPSLNFYSGKECCSADDFARYYTCLVQHCGGKECCELPDAGRGSGILDAVISHLMRTIQFRIDHRSGERPMDLLPITLDQRFRKATDPRDKVFAFVGMASCNSVPADLVQYNHPVLQTMVQIATKLIRASNTLEVVRHAANPLPSEEHCSDQSESTERLGSRDSLQRLQGLPSWCPDWAQEIPDKVLERMKDYRDDMLGRFGAGIAYQANMTFHGNYSLGLTSIMCDRVLLAGEVALTDSSIPGLGQKLQTLRQWCHMVADSRSHRTAQCHGCGKSIYGVWFSCQSCDDFAFCCRCMRTPPEPHATEHKFSQVFFKSTVRERNEEDWGDLIKEAQQRNTDLRRVPDFESEQRDGDYPFRRSDSSWTQLSHTDYPFTEGDNLQDAFRRTLVGGYAITWWNGPRQGEPLSALDEMAAFLMWWYKLVLRWPFVPQTGIEDHDGESDLDYALNRVTGEKAVLVHQRTGYILDRRRMVVSQKGYIGLAPAGTRIGDHICVLHGGEMPFILREWNPDGGSKSTGGTTEDYVLVGEAYVHGLMHGEAVAAADAGELQRVQVILH